MTAAHRVQRPGVQRLQGLGDAPVEEAPLGRADLGVGHLAQLVVGEVVLVGADLPDDAALPQLVERADDARPRWTDRPRGAGRARSRGRWRRRAGPARAPAAESCASRDSITACTLEGSSTCPAPRCPCGGSGAEPGPGHLDDEERVALASRGTGAGRRASSSSRRSRCAGQPRGLRGVERLERDLGHRDPAAAEVEEQSPGAGGCTGSSSSRAVPTTSIRARASKRRR